MQDEDIDIVELGKASEETQGGFGPKLEPSLIPERPI